MAANVSPPPATENASLAAMASASAMVPAPKLSNSNTPTGPFQIIVPADAIIPKRLVLTRASAEAVRDLVERPPAPTEAMKQLFDDR